jgi:hypothetical protein
MRKILKIPMSDSTVSRRIQDLSQGVESEAIANIKEASFFAIKLDESNDITGKAQLLAFSRFLCNGNVIEQFVICKPLPGTTKGQDILDVIESYFSSHHLSRKSCISI